MITGDPWASAEYPLGSQTPQPKLTTRADLILAAAEAIFEAVMPPEGIDAIRWEDAPSFLRDAYMGDAAAALDAAYPTVNTEAQIDGLGWMAIIVNERGSVYQRDIASDNRLDHGGRPWSRPGSDSGRHRVGQFSASLVASGPWTVVFRGQA